MAAEHPVLLGSRSTWVDAPRRILPGAQKSYEETGVVAPERFFLEALTSQEDPPRDFTLHPSRLYEYATKLSAHTPKRRVLLHGSAEARSRLKMGLWSYPASLDWALKRFLLRAQSSYEALRKLCTISSGPAYASLPLETNL
jgi:hypothetical protein